MIALALAAAVLAAVVCALAIAAAIGLNGETESGTYGVLVIVMIGTIILAILSVGETYQQAKLKPKPEVRVITRPVPLPIPWPVGSGLEARSADRMDGYAEAPP